MHSYLGVLFTSSMPFSSHINNIIAKASKMLNFIQQNLSKCTKDMKSTAYHSLVRPILEYSSLVWDPYLLAHIQSIEKVQRSASRWVLSDYSTFNSVTSMLNELQWPTLFSRQKFARLSTFLRSFIIYQYHPSLTTLFQLINYSTSPSQPSLQHYQSISKNQLI